MNELVKLRKRIKKMERSETERNRVEGELRSSEEKLRIIIENVRDVIFQLSPKGFIQYISPNVKELYGYASEELIGKHLKKTTPMSEVPKALEALKAVLSGKVIENFEINQKDSKGKIIPMEINIAPVKKEGKIIAVQGVMRDITERKKVENELRESEERLSRFMDSATDSFVLFDAELNIVEVNERAAVGFSLKKKDIIGKNLLDFVPTLKDTGRYDKYLEVIRTGKPLFIDDLVPHPKFGDIHIALKAFKVGDGLGIITIDITQRKQIEEQLKKTLEELKQRNQELDEYTYTVSHELKTPLIAIQGFSAILYKKCRNKLNKNMVQYLKRISQASERLERMVSDLLKLSRAGRKTGKFNKVDINSVVKISLKHFESSIIEKHIDVKLTPEFPTVSCDRSRIIEVFDNLIANAIRFAGLREKPKIKIGWKKQKEQYQFWVEDNGVGIIEGDKKKIFKAYVQGSLVSSEEGTGVGLSIVKKVIESHGGKIWVKSELGSGTKFYFTIPL